MAERKDAAAKAWLADAMPDPLVMAQMNQRFLECWMNGAGEMAREMMGFVQGRLREDAALWTKVVTGAQQPADVLETQRHYFEKMTNDYFEEGNRLGRLAMQIANDSLSLAPPRKAAAE